MTSPREYIRKILGEECEINSHVFCERSCYDVFYNKEEIKTQCDNLKKGFDLITENMELAYFVLDIDEVCGAAWIDKTKSKFNFAIATSEEAPENVFEGLVHDCMDEYLFLKTENNSLCLEVKVEDEETESFLKKNYQLKELRHYPGIVILGE